MPESTTSIIDIPPKSRIDRVKDLFRGSGYFSILLVPFMISSMFLYFFILDNFENKNHCVISSSDLCDRQYVELEGVVEDAVVHGDFGYRFVPDNEGLENPIYIRNVIYTGADLLKNGNKKVFDGKMRFGEKIKVRGLVHIYDHFRCEDPDFYRENKRNCSSDSYRVMILPTSVSYISDKKLSTAEYSVFGRMRGHASIQQLCDSGDTFEVCDISGEGGCIRVHFEDKNSICNNIKKLPEKFYLSVTENLNNGDKSIREFVQIGGITYFGDQDVSGIKINSGDTQRHEP